MPIDETLADIGVDRKVTTLNIAALLYALNGSPPTLDAVIAVEDFLDQVINTIGTRFYQMNLFASSVDVAVGDGAGDAGYMLIPAEFNGWNLTVVRARVITPGTTGATTIQLANVTQGVDMLASANKLSIASGAYLDDGTVVIDTTNDDVATDDLLRWDVDARSTTPPKGLFTIAGFTKP